MESQGDVNTVDSGVKTVGSFVSLCCVQGHVIPVKWLIEPCSA